VDVLFHGLAAVGPLLPPEEVGAEVAAALTDEEGLREAADWLRRRMLVGGGVVEADPGSRRVTLELDSPMGLASLLFPLTGSLGWLVLAGAAPAYPSKYPGEEDTGAAPPGVGPNRTIPAPIPADAAEPNRRDLESGG